MAAVMKFATIRSHYDRLERIAEDVERLGYKVAAQILSEADRESFVVETAPLSRGRSYLVNEAIS